MGLNVSVTMTADRMWSDFYILSANSELGGERHYLIAKSMHFGDLLKNICYYVDQINWLGFFFFTFQLVVMKFYKNTSLS